MINFFANIFGFVLNAIYTLTNNYGFAIIIFSILIKLAMLPLSINQQKTLKQNEKLQEKIKILQIKNKGNTEKLNQEMMELYKTEKINPMSGCINVVIQFILILSMFYLVRSPLTYMKKIDEEFIDEQLQQIEQESTTVSKTYPEMSIIKYIQENNLKQNDMYINMNFLGLDLSKVPQENLSDFRVYIIPVLYVISSFVSMKMTTTMNNANKKKEDENGDAIKETALTSKEETAQMDQAELTAQMNKNMTFMMPILSVSVSLVAPLGLALYWLINNVIMIIERLVLNKFFSKEEQEDV